jgi:tRNA threonylcarbamoyladenosine biosynthesis protein TsaE
LTGPRLACPTAADTTAAGVALGEQLDPSDVVLVSGDLGSGKTTFVQGLVRGYGVDCPVTSPSFALIHVYGTSARQVVHVDPYRLRGAEDVDSIGLAEYLDTDAVIVIEWPERLGELTPPCRFNVKITANDLDVREIAIQRCGAPLRTEGRT